MINILTALKSKFASSTVSNDVAGRIYLDEYPPDEMPPAFPYIVYFVVSGVPDQAFNKGGKNIIVQFSIFSASAGATEISTIYKDLKALLDEQSLTITSNTLIWMRETNLITMVEDLDTVSGVQRVKHWAVDYELTTEAA